MLLVLLGVVILHLIALILLIVSTAASVSYTFVYFRSAHPGRHLLLI